jgi:hypothetical protein
MNKFNEQKVCFNIENFTCYTCKKSYSNIQDLSKHLISIQHEERINYNIGLLELDNQLLKLIEKDEHEKRMNCLKQELLEINKRTDKLREERKERVRIEKDEHEKRMNCLNQELLEINKRTDKLREERKERVRIEKERINAFLSLFCLKIV